MIWKAIGQSVIGTSHVAIGKPCEDSIDYKCNAGDSAALVCCVSDGAGSAAYAAWASACVTKLAVRYVQEHITAAGSLTEGNLYGLLEAAYEALAAEAANLEAPLNEFSCTLLLCVALEQKAAFVQIGDGAIIRDDGQNGYTAVWWPDNGEYQNTTSFLVDDATFANARITIIDEAVNEIAMLTDGLQMLTLNMESTSVHQPFFTDLFRHLRMADSEDKIMLLNTKLAGYLGGSAINSRTDDDKTLFLATKLPA